jgi:hypothetical protein
VTRSKGDHSKYPGALVGPDGEIYFRRGEGDAAPEAPAEPAPPVATDQPDNRKDSQQ